MNWKDLKEIRKAKKIIADCINRHDEKFFKQRNWEMDKLNEAFLALSHILFVYELIEKEPFNADF